MGVPTFYRWLSVKYPRILKDAVEGTPLPPEELTDAVPTEETHERPNGHFDNLYLDMNGIIHPCSHPEEGAPPSSEDEMFVKIFQYIDRLVDVVKPQQLLYMAIDGVAPRAKMNQQRTRRFKAAAEAEMEAATYADLCAQFEREGRSVPAKKEQWDSNVITPGTPFLDKLSRALHYYINDRMSSHPLWKKIRVILSDANCPGEGEHKIMDYIRAQRTYPGYNPNLRHCLHGADADLIMLGLATHEAHFYILREMVLEQASLKKCYLCGKGGHLASECTIGPSPDPTSPEAFKEAECAAPAAWKPLQFLSIPVLREYLANEFAFRDSTLFVPDFERCIDDFVLMCFFVGNDFLPHLPSLSIHKGSIDQMILLYQKIRPRLSDYLTNRGRINLSELRAFVHYLGLVEDNVFVEELRRQTHMKQKRNQDAAAAAQLAAAESQHGTSLNGATGPSSEQQSGASESSTQEDSNFQALKILKAQAQDAERKRLSGGGSDEPPLKKRQATVGSDDTWASELAQSGGEDADRTTDMCSPTPSKAARSHEEDIDAFKSEMRARRKAHTELDNPPDDIQLGVGQKKDWRYRYYQNKFHLMEGDDMESFAERVAQAYTMGLCWVLGYYYSGVPSWGWFYPFHYAPFASDISSYGLREIPLFTPGKPFTPFQQLMAVLPAQSGHCLPQQYAALMKNKDSPIIDFYPVTFKEDPDGKRYKWQWVVLLPFINEKRLLDALLPLEATLNEEQKQRNTSGCSLLFVAESHPLCSSVVSLQQEAMRGTSPPEDAEGGPTCTLQITTTGVGGALVCSYTKDYAPGTEMAAPASCSQEIFPPRRCVVGACWIRCPPQTFHVCALLPGAIPPAPVLKAVDLDPEAQGGRERRFNSQAAKRMIMGCLGRQGIVTREEVDRYFWGNRQRNASGAAPCARGYRNVHSDNRYQAETFGSGSTGGRWSTSTSNSRYSIEDESSISGSRSFNARGRLRDSFHSGRGGHGCTYPSPKILRHAERGVPAYSRAKGRSGQHHQSAEDHRSFGEVYIPHPTGAMPLHVYPPVANPQPYVANSQSRHQPPSGHPQILGRRNQHSRPPHVQGSSHHRRGRGAGHFEPAAGAPAYAAGGRDENLTHAHPPFPPHRHYAQSYTPQHAPSARDAFTAGAPVTTAAGLSMGAPPSARPPSATVALADPYRSARSTGAGSPHYVRPAVTVAPAIQMDKLRVSGPHSLGSLAMKPNWVPPARQTSVWPEGSGALRVPVGPPSAGGPLRSHPVTSVPRDPYSTSSRAPH